jgi:hypothetical protein
MAEDQPLAEVRTAKMKDCPVLTAGRITPLVLQSWSLACKRYMKHAEKKPTEIVSFVAEAMLEPRLIAWYQAGQTRIDKLSLDEYLAELSKLVLEKNWAHKIRDTIISSKQGDRAFIDWKIELENLNAILTTSSPSHALTSDALKVQLEASLNSELKLNLMNEPAVATTLDAWSIEVKERDERIKAEDARTQRIINANNAARAAKRTEKKDLLSRLSDPPRGKPTNTGTGGDSTRRYLPKLLDKEKRLLNEHDGCTRCRKCYAGHRAKDCPMTANNTWPDAETYVPITLEIALASKPQTNSSSSRLPAAAVFAEDRDDETDSCVDTSPLTVPHLVATLDAFGPNISEFPISIPAMLDIGCPSTVINPALVDQLGLRRYPLPPSEDNLASLTESPLPCKEFVKLELSSGNGGWKSTVFRAKVTTGLPVPLILGMPFLSSQHIVVDANARTAKDKRTGYDILNPVIPLRPRAPAYTVPPPTPPKLRAPPIKTLETASEPALAGYLLPAPIMAAVRERIEVISFQEMLGRKDAEMKHKYKDRFPTCLPDTTDGVPDHIYHRIRLKDPSKVVKGRSYSPPKKYHDSWKKLLDEHLSAGRIRPSSSEHSSPAFCVPKFHDGAPNLAVPPRWVNDYRELNKNTIRDNFPLPRVDDILADCGQGKIFGKMDMTNSFFQTRVHPDDIHLTAVRTPWGLYEWTVMPMGGCNAPSTHQRWMTDALRELIGKICHVYLDDIIIWSQTTEEHEVNIAKVLDALRAANLFCNGAKTTLFSTEISFLGHKILGAGMRADPKKIDRILDWPKPTTSTNVRGFLGLTRYLAAFLPALAEHTSILTPLTTKECDREFPIWTSEHQKAFEAIKQLVTGVECLTVINYDDTTKKIFVTTDASDRRTGAVLSFGETWENARPVAYDSYQLNDAERNYPVHEKELLAIIKALKKWRTSLLGTHFEVFTDHRTLEYFQSQKDMSRRQMRWSMYLADFDYDITYIRGEDNTAADALSRMPDATPNPLLAACALAYTRSPSRRQMAALATLDISADESLLMDIISGYQDDEFAKQLTKDINAGSIEGARMENSLLYVGRRLLIPNIPRIRELFYNLAHDALGHFGFDKSYEALWGSYYWPNMRRDLEKAYIPSCSPCQRNKSRTTKPTGPLHPLPVPDARFEAVALDFVGPLPEEDGKDTILTMTNLLGAEVRLAAIHSSATAAEVAVVLFDEWYCENRLMRQIITDRDALFTAELWAALHKLTGVKLKMSTAYHPQTDGASERTNKTLNQAIRYHVDNNQKGWLAKLPRVHFAIMNTVNASTGFSPFQLKTGRSPRLIPPLVPTATNLTPAEADAREIITRLELDVKEAQDNLLAAKIRQAYHANEHRAPEIIYNEGDLVMLSTEHRRRNYKRKGKKRVAKFMPRSDGPYTVVKSFPEKSEYTLRLPNNSQTFPGFHSSLLKPFVPNDPTLFPDCEFTRPGAVVTEDGTEENMIDKIVDARRRGRGKQYLVRWVGYDRDHDEWLSGRMLEDTEALDVWEAENGTEV